MFLKLTKLKENDTLVMDLLGVNSCLTTADSFECRLRPRKQQNVNFGFKSMLIHSVEMFCYQANLL